MILNCKVAYVLLFFCCLVTVEGHVQGDIERHIITMSKTVDNLKSFTTQDLKRYSEDFQKIALNILKLITENEDGEKLEKIKTIPTLTMAEMIYYQGSNSGRKGLGHYVDLEAINNGKLSKNIIPILSEINKEQQNTNHEVRLFKFLNDVALLLIEKHEETELEAYFRECWQDRAYSFLSKFDKIKSQSLQKLGKKVLLKLLEQSKNYKKIEDVIDFYTVLNESDKDFVSDLLELWRNNLVELPIDKALKFVKSMRFIDYRVTAYEIFLNSSKADDLVKVIDEIFDIEINDRGIVHKLVDLRKKIPYNDESLQEIIKNSNESFNSFKLKAMMARNYLQNDPNELKILEFGWEMEELPQKWHIDYNYLQETVKMLPENVRAIVEKKAFCFVTVDGRYIHVENVIDARVTKANSEKPKTGKWTLLKNSINVYQIKNKNIEYSFIINPNRYKHAMIGPYYMQMETITSWTFTFMDVYKRVKISNEENYLRIENNTLVFDGDDKATIWNLTIC